MLQRITEVDGWGVAFGVWRLFDDDRVGVRTSGWRQRANGNSRFCAFLSYIFLAFSVFCVAVSYNF